MRTKRYKAISYGRRNRYSRSGRSSLQTDVSKYIHKTSPKQQADRQEVEINFSDLDIHRVLKQNILNRGFKHLTQIQKQAIFPILDGKDVVGIANTGTGKTGAFLIPLIHTVTQQRDKRVLIVVPTRELALQIFGEIKEFSTSLGIYAVTVIGGANMNRQISSLQRRPQFVIGTPGRLKDLIQRKKLNLQTFNTLVLDEVDRMLDMGFVHEIRQLVALLPKEKQSLFFSATLSNSINAIIQNLAKNPISIHIESQSKTDHIEQDVVRVKFGEKKIEILHNLLIQDELQKTLIFGRTKRGVDRLSRDLEERGFKVTAIHGDKSQSRRNKAIKLFSDDVVNIMVATDVASRGIDIDDITHVINFDAPESYDDYIHRIGRTGRAGRSGKALTFVETTY